ncbi:unnamed protein product, partial [marine sediment metagenome]
EKEAFGYRRREREDFSLSSERVQFPLKIAHIDKKALL